VRAPSYHVYISPLGNVFMTEFAEVLAVALEVSGREVQVRRNGLPAKESGTINLVVAPHEYFTLYEGADEASIVRAAAQSVSVGVEQPGTYWFEYGARYASYGPFALDINRRAVNELRRRGVETYRLHPGYSATRDAWGGATGSERDCDVLFLGSLTDRRAEFLAESAQILSDWECDIRLFAQTRPVRRGSDHFVVGRAKDELLARSKVLLNVHQGSRDYFEWIRILEAISNGCLVVTEDSGGYAPLLPNQHFLQSPLSSLAGRLDGILRDDDTRAELAQNAYAFVQKHLNFVDLVDQLLTTVELRAVKSLPPAVTRSTAPADVEFRRPGRRAPASLPFVPLETVHEAFDHWIVSDRKNRSLIKDAMLAEISEARVLEATIAYLEHGSAEHAITYDTAGYLSAAPEVSVVLTHYNYARFVRDAIESVVASTDVVAEIVIVDNHSAPDEFRALKEIVQEYEWFPIRLIANSADQGPAGSRNLGARNARAEFLFLLDADNLVYPNGLHLLVATLRKSMAAFAYGLVEIFGEHSGLLSTTPWDIDRLLEGNYIDTMAMIRREVWEEFGGFDPEIDAIGGYDDYAFWLKLAEAGHWGDFVSTFVGRYRVHGTSWQSVLNLHTQEFTQYYRDRYPSLPWPA
jgi:Glycosyl transferase family 2/Glycosyl transferases group 1